MQPDFSLNFSCSSHLPRLSWCMTIEKGSNTASVLHGPWVETHNDWFCEGAWAGEFGSAEFDTRFMTGTGAKNTPGGILLVAPDPVLDRILILRKGQKIYASNSLSFLLASANESLDPHCLFYDGYWSSIIDGIRRYKKSIPTRNRLNVQLFYHCNILVDANLNLSTQPKQQSPSFEDFSNYKSHLETCVSELARNCNDSQRAISYTPLTTLSAGYDSPATAVMAMTVGCNDAITFRNSRDVPGKQDCGTPIAEQLGLDITEFDRLAYRDRADFPEAENSGGPNEFLSFDESVSAKMLFTGHPGTMWTRNSVVSRDFIRADAAGVAITEFKLRTGFIHLPIPFIAGDSKPSISQISNSAEMAPWSIGGQYDRPIARRLVEEAGVDRALFGQHKNAAGVVVSHEGLEATMSKASLEDFREYVQSNWDRKKSVKTRFASALRVLVKKNERLATLVRKGSHKLGLPLPRVPHVVPRQLRCITYGYLGEQSLLFHWGVEKLMKRYRDVIDE